MHKIYYTYLYDTQHVYDMTPRAAFWVSAHTVRTREIDRTRVRCTYICTDRESTKKKEEHSCPLFRKQYDSCCTKISSSYNSAPSLCSRLDATNVKRLKP